MLANQKLLPWQFWLAVVGTMLWFVSLPFVEAVKAHGWATSDKLLSGYIVGFVGSFAGYVFWEFAKGRRHNFMVPNPCLHWISYLALIVILTTGTAGLFVGIFGSPTWSYNIGALAATAAFGQGLLPVIECHDTRQG